MVEKVVLNRIKHASLAGSLHLISLSLHVHSLEYFGHVCF